MASQTDRRIPFPLALTKTFVKLLFVTVPLLVFILGYLSGVELITIFLRTALSLIVLGGSGYFLIWLVGTLCLEFYIQETMNYQQVAEADAGE